MRERFERRKRYENALGGKSVVENAGESKSLLAESLSLTGVGGKGRRRVRKAYVYKYNAVEFDLRKDRRWQERR